MKLVELTLIREDNSDFDKLEVLIARLFKSEIYIPLMTELQLNPSTLQNSVEDLMSAIQSGRITYYRGKFKGRFSSTLSRELRKIGAEWDKVQGCFLIPISKLPTNIRTSISLSQSAFQQKINKVVEKLSKIMPDQLAEKLQATDLFDTVLWKTEKKFEQSVKNISIAPKITDEQRKRIAEEYTQNMQLYIQDFAEKEINSLREDIEKAAFNGDRYESLIGKIQKSYGVSQRKAKFLARQETSLMMTKYKQTRYQAAGVNEYKWRCVHNPKDSSPDMHTRGNVRFYHAKNDGKIFNWAEGAIVNETGEKKNPGQDYNCRCVAVPIVRFY